MTTPASPNAVPPRPASGSDDLVWEALRYHLGELAEDEAAAFEARLLTDAAVAEALIQAVELAAAVHHVETLAEQIRAEPIASEAVPATSGERILRVAPATAGGSVWRPIAWMLAGAGGCLAVLAGLLQLDLLQDGAPASAATDPAGALAVRWSHITLARGSAATQSAAPTEADPDNDDAEEPAAMLATSDEDWELILEAPDESHLAEDGPRPAPAWMLKVIQPASDS